MHLSISRGKVHEYLGMIFDYTNTGEVKITMYQYVTELLKHAPSIYISGAMSPTPAPNHSCEVRDPDVEAIEILPVNEKREYHTLIAQCLYLSRRAPPDIQQAVAFHCTRVKSPDTDVDKKLACTVRYIMKTIHLPLILKVNDNGVIQWWVDTSFAVNEDMCSRTGMNMTLGEGMIYAASLKQRINTSSSTEAELVGVVDALPKMIWCRYFMEAQEYLVEDVYVYQDNESAILLETNGMKSVNKGSRHIDIKYFFITDNVKGKELKIISCPTEEMRAGFYTKPLQGAVFIKHRDAIFRIDNEHMSQYIKSYDDFISSLEAQCNDNK